MSTWKINETNFEKWVGSSFDELSGVLRLKPPSVASLVYFVLEEFNRSCTYKEIQELLIRKEIISKEIPQASLRTGVHSLAKTLSDKKYKKQVLVNRGSFNLVDAHSKDIASDSKEEKSILLLQEVIRAEDIAKDIIQQGRIPFQGLYFLQWSARWWEAYSGKEADDRAPYECESLERLKTIERLNLRQDQEMNFVGIAPGEGIAEIKILEKLLRTYKTKVHYLAVDTSPRLLQNHIGLIKEAFKVELREGRLLLGGMVENALDNLSTVIERMQVEFESRFNIDYFFKSESTLATFLGNCLGNDKNREIDYISSIYSSLTSNKVEIIVGVSVDSGKQETYQRNWDEFLLQTPRYLLTIAKLLDSADSTEFIQESNAEEVTQEDYIGPFNIKGKVYSFRYRLKSDVSLTNSHISRPEGSPIVLYDIIKYDLGTLMNAIEQQKLFDNVTKDEKTRTVSTENGERIYQLFSLHKDKSKA